ncbi:MAG: Transcriptional regulator, AcrR-family [Herbinix sp.]|nr:Transcriptional regulator, AcrR-family [Herbinix sp.]
MTELFNRIPEEKRNRIFEAAINEFAIYGYMNANTNKIARKAEISVGSLFQYFNNKEDLFLTVVKHCASIMKTALEDIMMGDEKLLVKVEKLLRTIQKHSRENINMIRLYNEMATQSNSIIIGEIVRDMETLTAKLYSELIQEAQYKLEARTDCDPGMFAFLLDNIFMMLQFSYSCDYYKERFKIYVKEDVLDHDDYVIEQTLRFIKSAFSPTS